jgi:hypothetical protein
MHDSSVLNYPPVAALHVWLFALGAAAGLALPTLALVAAVETAARLRLRK